MFNLKGRVAVISGASSGLGKQMAKAFAEQGADLAILARRVERLEELKNEIEPMGVRVLPIKCDVTSTEDINNAARIVEETYGKVDILVNSTLVKTIKIVSEPPKACTLKFEDLQKKILLSLLLLYLHPLILLLVLLLVLLLRQLK